MLTESIERGFFIVSQNKKGVMCLLRKRQENVKKKLVTSPFKSNIIKLVINKVTNIFGEELEL